MNLDPYQILGVAHDASDEEVTKAYKSLAKKYHPDLNPGNQEAAQKMSELNAAYDDIKSGKANYAYGNAHGTAGNPGTYQGGTTYDPFGGYGSYRTARGGQSDPFEGFDPFEWIFGAYANQNQNSRSGFDAVISYLNSGYYREALNVLSQMSDRNAKWYYYSAIANYGVGNRETACDYAKTAVEMEPDNAEYQSILSQIEKEKGGFGRRKSAFSPLGTVVKFFVGFYVIQFLFSFLHFIF